MIQWIMKHLAGEEFLKWLGSFVSNEGSTSASKLALVYATTTLSVCTIIMTIAIVHEIYTKHYSAYIEYGTLVGALLAAAGVSYSVKKIVGQKADPTKVDTHV